jgi:acyl-CoA thioester hydrolase
MDGKISMSNFYETTARVRYAETDRMGVVYYANYLVWFEIGRVETFRQMGLSYKEMEEADDSWAVVAKAQCRYLKPVFYDDLVCIRTQVTESRSRTLRFGYEIRRQGTDELLATGETLHVICDGKNRPKALPEKYRKYFPLTARQAGNEPE